MLDLGILAEQGGVHLQPAGGVEGIGLEEGRGEDSPEDRLLSLGGDLVDDTEVDGEQGQQEEEGDGEVEQEQVVPGQGGDHVAHLSQREALA